MAQTITAEQLRTAQRRWEAAQQDALENRGDRRRQTIADAYGRQVYGNYAHLAASKCG